MRTAGLPLALLTGLIRPVGCIAGLSYGNPAYGDSQVKCTCIQSAGGIGPSWDCPI